MKPKLLVLELWGIGDLIIASPFLRAACETHEVHLLAQAYAEELRPHFWPEVQVIPFRMPWTVHRGKYRLHTWPWIRLTRLIRRLRRERFDLAVSARWDPRDDVLMWLSGTRERTGFPRLGSARLESLSLEKPDPLSHRYERWRVLGHALGIRVPALSDAVKPRLRPVGHVTVHTGAAKALRVWPLPRVQRLVRRLREGGYSVHVACDPNQADWWREQGEAVAVPTNMNELVTLFEHTGAFIGNDSGPGHVAGYMGIPTLTLFGPQVPEWFVPLHPQAEWIEGVPCPYKPCFDYCRFKEPFCLTGITEEQVQDKALTFLQKHLEPPKTNPARD